MTDSTIKPNPFKRQWVEIREDVLSAVERVGEHADYIMGPELLAFESAFAMRQDRGFAVGCGNGLDAIEIALRALGISVGDRVITTPFSAFATTLAIIRAGGVPVFVDVNSHGAIDLEQAAECIEADPGIRYCVPVHLYGMPIEMQTLQELKSRYSIAVVEDCSQAVGASFSGKPVGSASSIAAYSFYPTKNLGALGDAGAITTDDETLAGRCRQLRDYGQSEKYRHDRLGMNSRLDELHAGILNSAILPRLNPWIARRGEIAERYIGSIRHPSVETFTLPAAALAAWHLFPVRVDARKREQFLHYLHDEGILASVHYPVLIPDQAALKDGVDASTWRKLDTASQFASEEVSLPIHPFLVDEEIDRVCRKINEWSP
jgi:dTDP-4-amino-4,6-dideoxygalactose transaminase